MPMKMKSRAAIGKVGRSSRPAARRADACTARFARLGVRRRGILLLSLAHGNLFLVFRIEHGRE